MEFVEIHVGEGRTLLVEADIEDTIVAAGRARDLAATGAETFESAMDSIRDAANVAVARMMALSRPPEEVVVQFAIQLAAEAGVVVARTTATANMSVSLTWRAPGG